MAAARHGLRAPTRDPTSFAFLLFMATPVFVLVNWLPPPGAFWQVSATERVAGQTNMYMQTELHGVPIFISVTINRALKTINHSMNVGCARSLQANVSVLSFTVFAFWENTTNKTIQ